MDEYGTLKRTLYYKYADSVGFGELSDPNAVFTGASGVTFSVTVPSEELADFVDVSKQVTTIVGLQNVSLVSRSGDGTVRELCAVFLDAVNSKMFRRVVIDQASNKVIADAVGEGDNAADYAASHYGDLAVIQGPGEITEQSRNATSPPTGAGTGLWQAGIQARNCTQGYTLRNNDSNVVYATSAAHCEPAGTPFVSGGTVGVWAGDLTSSGDMDVAFIGGGSYSNSIWRGAANTSTQGTVLGALTASVPTNATVYFSGSSSGESHAIYAASGCDGEYCSLLFFYGRNTQGGDSGGPWFAAISGSNDVYAIADHRGVYTEYTTGIVYMVASDIRTAAYLTNSTVLG